MIRIWSTLVIVAVALAVCLNAAQVHAKKKSEKMPRKAEELFKNLDANRDGKVSKEEFIAGAKALDAKLKDPEKAKIVFDKIDTNRDGWISLDELKAWMRKVEAWVKRNNQEGGKKPDKSNH